MFAFASRIVPRWTPGLVGLALLLGGCATFGGTQHAVIHAKDKVAPALVHVRPVKEVYTRGKREEFLAVGSGFILSPDGYVCTNEHVAGQSKIVYCVLGDKTEVEAEVVGVDSYTDIAVLKLKTPRKLPYVKLGDSDKIKVGQTVLALGSPHGLARSVSMGIISVADRYLEGGALPISPFNTWIQTDAAINPGNSGGPLVNLRGEVIGVNARKLSEAENVGFAIPINVVKEVVEAIKKDGRVKRSSVGVNLQEMHAKTSDPTKEGVVIADVDTLSPANQAQIRPGDILLAVNGAPVDARFAEDLPPVRKRIADLPVGEKAVFTVLRGDKKIDIDVVTEESGAPRGKEVELSEWGMSIAELTPDIVRAAQLTARKGVIVSGVQVGGIAANAHLDQGDIILKLDDAEVANLDQFMTKYRELVSAKKRLTMLFVKHAALTRFVIVKQEAADAPVQAGGNGNAQ